jgi:hypothetical protein
MMATKHRLKIQCVLFQMMALKRPIEDSMCFFALNNEFSNNLKDW